MGKIYIIMGKSASGKDSIFQEIIEDKSLGLQQIVPYTTRPIREQEQDGKEYHFVTDEQVEQLEAQGKIIELRTYHTVKGLWKYFTVDDGQIDVSKNDYLMIGTLETYIPIRNYFGEDKVEPIYIYVPDGERLRRAINREEKEEIPQFEEMCRRFLADAEDFSEEKLKDAGIDKVHRFLNNEFESTVMNVKTHIQQK